MLDIGWQELIVIGVLALLVVGPKELPGLLRQVGRWAGKARSVAREFQRSMEDAAREADLEEFKKLRDVKRDVEKMGRVDFSEQARRAQASLSSHGQAGTRGRENGAAKAEPAQSPPPPASETPAPPASAPADEPKS